jgi:SSS family solute:Na+ symporter
METIGWIILCGLSWFVIKGVIVYIAYKRTLSTMDSFFVAERSFGVIVTLFAWMGTMFSAYMFLGLVGMAYKSGLGVMIQWYIISLMPLSFILIGIPAWKLGKKYGYVSPIDLFVDRYESKFLRYWLAIMSLFVCVPYLIMQCVGGGWVLQGATGGQIPYWVGVVILAIVMACYLIPGGFKGMSWVDAVQGGLLSAVLASATIFLYLKAGGDLAGVTQKIIAAKPLDKLLTIPGLVPVWTYNMFIFMGVMGFSWGLFPQMYPRYYAARDEKVIVIFALIFGLIAPLMFFHTTILGQITRILIPGLTGKQVDSVLALAIGKFAPKWLTGMLIAAVFGAIISTSGGFILSAAALITKDIYKPLAKGKSEKHVVMVGRILILVIILISVLIALNPPTYLVFLGLIAFAVGIQMAPLMFAAYYWPRGNKYGAIAGSLVGMGILIFHLFLGEKYLYTSLWGIPPGLLAFVPNLAIFIVVSLLTKPSSEETIEKFHGLLKRTYMPKKG